MNELYDTYIAELTKLLGDRVVVKTFSYVGATVVSSGVDAAGKSMAFSQSSQYQDLLESNASYIVSLFGRADHTNFNLPTVEHGGTFNVDYGDLLKKFKTDIRTDPSPTVFMVVPPPVPTIEADDGKILFENPGIGTQISYLTDSWDDTHLIDMRTPFANRCMGGVDTVMCAAQSGLPYLTPPCQTWGSFGCSWMLQGSGLPSVSGFIEMASIVAQSIGPL